MEEKTGFITNLPMFQEEKDLTFTIVGYPADKAGTANFTRTKNDTIGGLAIVVITCNVKGNTFSFNFVELFSRKEALG